MDRKKKSEIVIAQIAYRNGEKVEDVKKKIAQEIGEAYKNKGTKEKWDKIFGKDIIPTPEEFLVALANQLLNFQARGSIHRL